MFWDLFFNKVAGLKLQASGLLTLLKKKLQHSWFVSFAKFLRTLFYRTPPDDCFCPLNFLTLFRISILENTRGQLPVNILAR